MWAGDAPWRSMVPAGETAPAAQAAVGGRAPAVKQGWPMADLGAAVHGRGMSTGPTRAPELPTRTSAAAEGCDGPPWPRHLTVAVKK
jgi:hypothetical protein